MKRASGVVVATVVLTAAIARAQTPGPDPSPPTPPTPPSNGSGSGNGSGDAGPGAGGDVPSGADTTPDGTTGTTGDTPPLPPEFGDPYTPTPHDRAPAKAEKPEPPRPPLSMPEVLTTPTGWLLPAAVLYSKTSLDTGGGVTSDTRVGLGDVAEFGIATTDQVRERLDPADVRASRIQPYVTASFRLGVAENRLFAHQPGVTLGFRKSFERNHDGFKTRIAELTLVASKHLGKRAAIHIGGAFWDASLEGVLDREEGAERREITLHGMNDLRKQVRAFGGIEVRPLPRSQILVDLGWAPEFCYHCPVSPERLAEGVSPDANRIRLRPTLSWGVRYEVAQWMRLESGVRVPDIAEANLLDAQIFGQITFTSWALRRGVDSLK